MEILEVIREALNQMVDRELTIENHSVSNSYLKPPYRLFFFFNVPSQSGIHDNIPIHVFLIPNKETEQLQYVKDKLHNIALAKVEVDLARKVARIKSYKMNI